jgi:hypothetical protein
VEQHPVADMATTTYKSGQDQMNRHGQGCAEAVWRGGCDNGCWGAVWRSCCWVAAWQTMGGTDATLSAASAMAIDSSQQLRNCITVSRLTPKASSQSPVPVRRLNFATLKSPYWGGELLHVDMFAHNKSGIAYRDGNRRSKTVVNHKREPHQQLRLYCPWPKPLLLGGRAATTPDPPSHTPRVRARLQHPNGPTTHLQCALGQVHHPQVAALLQCRCHSLSGHKVHSNLQAAAPAAV